MFLINMFNFKQQVIVSLGGENVTSFQSLSMFALFAKSYSIWTRSSSSILEWGPVETSFQMGAHTCQTLIITVDWNIGLTYD